VTTVPGAYGVVGLRVPGALAYRHLAIRLVSTACKMALESDSRDGPASHVSHDSGGPASHVSHDSDGDFEAEVVSAFGEAFNNIAVHGYDGLAPQPVQIEVDWDHEKLVITCVDNGHTFDPETVALPDLDALPEHGMGLFIMRSCMDQIDYRPGPPNVLRLIKLRSRRDGLLPPPPPSSSRVFEGVTARPAADDEGHAGGRVGGHAGGRAGGVDSDKDAGVDSDRGSGVDLIPPANESCTGPAGGRSGSRARIPVTTTPGEDLMVESSRRR